MRIIEPNKTHQKKQKTNKMWMFSKFILLIFLGLAVLLLMGKKVDEPNINGNIDSSSTSKNQDSIKSDNSIVKSDKKTLRIFTDNEFRVFYDNLLQPNLERVTNPPSITGNTVADARIRKIAEDRGYKLRHSASVELVKVEGELLQNQVVGPWASLKAAAKQAGLNISIVSGYRSVETQRALFTSRLNATGATVSQVAEGLADDKVNSVLVTSSIPGYSKHHTGYTLDMLCAGFAFENFKNSTCNTWISVDNYRVAKENGFIPSYPPQADAQGPDPEAWEYVYVGTDLLYE